MRPLDPAKNFEISRRFFVDLGFQSQTITDSLVEMRLGDHSFILQNYCIRQRADNFVMHMCVYDVGAWCEYMVRLDLAARYGVKILSPKQEDWGLMAGLVDPSGVLWRIAETPVSSAG
jgi:hypothetical protein